MQALSSAEGISNGLQLRGKKKSTRYNNPESFDAWELGAAPAEKRKLLAENDILFFSNISVTLPFVDDLALMLFTLAAATRFKNVSPQQECWCNYADWIISIN
jgi:hypothetical protein